MTIIKSGTNFKRLGLGIMGRSLFGTLMVGCSLKDNANVTHRKQNIQKLKITSINTNINSNLLVVSPYSMVVLK
ncbi:hypothetical protein PGLA_03680 [Paenibacillus glacialis]|uniref:Uncharacterized protein n=1 Tax=Paenibacillus glacialis TaxID=494026 RepID=A0A168N3X0_9BACL|nr:hypothetical protein PGLA_03680 [Paenibacillus glacialis]